METSHTPGPWKQHATPGKIYASVRGADGRCVADCGSRSDVIAQANAEFIVRACNAHDDLLEALEACERALDEAYFAEPDGCGCLACESLRKARAAIAKAKG